MSARHCRRSRVARDLKCFEIGDGKLRLVVQHLFEMRNEPVFVDRIAMKAAAELIVHSALSPSRAALSSTMSRASSLPVRCLVAQQEIVNARGAEIWARCRSRRAGNRTCGGMLKRAVEHSRLALRSEPRLARARLLRYCSITLRAGFHDLRRGRSPMPAAMRRARAETRRGHSGCPAGKYVPPNERLQIRRQPDRHRPSAAAGGRLHVMSCRCDRCRAALRDPL